MEDRSVLIYTLLELRNYVIHLYEDCDCLSSISCDMLLRHIDEILELYRNIPVGMIPKVKIKLPKLVDYMIEHDKEWSERTEEEKSLFIEGEDVEVKKLWCEQEISIKEFEKKRREELGYIDAVPLVLSVKTFGAYTLYLNYENEVRMFDCSKLQGTYQYAKLNDTSYFKQVYVKNGIVMWDRRTTINPKFLYEQSVPCDANTYENMLAKIGDYKVLIKRELQKIGIGIAEADAILKKSGYEAVIDAYPFEQLHVDVAQAVQECLVRAARRVV